VEKSWSTCVRLEDSLACMASTVPTQDLKVPTPPAAAPFVFLAGVPSYEGTPYSSARLIDS